MKRKGMFAQGMALILSAAMIGGLNWGVSAEAAKAPKLSAARKTINAGSSFTLKLKSNGTKIKSTKWTSAKPGIARLSKAGKTSVKVQGKKDGKSKITAKVTYKTGKKKVTKKFNCTVTVNKVKAVSTPTPTVAPTLQPTNVPAATQTPAPTAKPYYYYSYDYFGMFDASKSSEKENLYVNFVLSDSWQTNTKLSAIEQLEFKLDTTSSFDVDIYVAEYDCDVSDSANATKIATVTTNGTKSQEFSVDVKGDPAIAAFDSTNNGRISFGFIPADGKGKFVIHDMSVDYYNNNTKGISYHKAAISVETSSVGSAKNRYNKDKKAADDAKDKSFSKTLNDYLAELPAGLYEVTPKDASDAINNYSSMAELTNAKGYMFGTCVTYDLIKNDPEFCKLLAHHCDSITAMNEFKAYSLLDKEATLAAYKDDETSMPQMKYEKADFICEWARANNIKIRGHALVWDNSMEENHRWFFTKGFDQNGEYASNEICRKRLQYYVDQVMRHFQEKYPDVVYCWDVVNEGCDENSGDKLKIRQNRMGQNPFYYHCSSEANGKGENYIKFTFNCAYDTREAMIKEGLLSNKEKIELVYNDYNVIEDNKRPYVKGIVEMLNEDPSKQLCDSVGAQGYLGAYQKQQGCLEQSWVDKTTKTIKEFSSMNPSVHVQLTEMAMRNFDWDYLEQHGTFAANLFEGLANINQETNNSFTSMSMWAFIDDPVMNKVEESFDYWQYAPFSGLFDDVYRVKPAFRFAHEILSR